MARSKTQRRSTKSPSVRVRIDALRQGMRKLGLSAYLVPSTDPHQSEYLPECWQRRPFISGFTGSAGDVVITRTKGGLWTDGRYYLQAAQELRGSGITLFKAAETQTPTKAAWLATQLGKGEILGVDPRLVTTAQVAEYETALGEVGAKVRGVDRNLVDAVWPERPAMPTAPIRLLAKRFTGETTASKLRRVRKEVAEAGAEHHVVTTLDSIAWLFNLRGADVDYNPVAISYAIVGPKRAALFIDPAKVPQKVAAALRKHVDLQPYRDFGAALQRLGRAKRAVLVDPATSNAWVARRLRGAKLVEKASPIVAMKARKNDVEIAGMRAAHVRDGVAMVRFMRWLEEAVPNGGVTEISAADELERLRSEGEHFQGLSFNTISGYAEHGAIIHYAADEESDVPLRAKGIYLLDSGGQYLDGTTDITRTVLLGKSASKEQRDRFTRVLKGHIDLALAVFPQGVSGIRLDTLARRSLWDAGLDYGHGTGHGVGAFLNVHEGPQSISVRGHVPLEEGNILSNEPGYYAAGAYGIRIENLVVVGKAAVGNGKPFFAFDTLTMCPIDTRLVEPGLLAPTERAWLDDYHATVYRTLAPHLAGADKRWLRRATRPV